MGKVGCSYLALQKDTLLKPTIILKLKFRKVKMLKKFKQIITVLTILLTMLMPGRVWALDIPTAPTPPPQPEITKSSTAPTPPPEPTTPPAPEAPTLEAILAPTPTPIAEENQSESIDPSPSPTTETSSVSESNSNEYTDNNYSGPEANGNVGDTTITTGNATTTGTITTSANNNLADTSVSEEAGGTTVTNSGNGSESDNSAAVNEDASINTIQDNQATVLNDLTLQSDSGNSSASQNVGDTSITTGDANTSGTVVTELNSNLAGLAVSEFNVADDQVGDLILDFAASCIIGCDIFNSSLVENTGNGSDSENSAALAQNQTNSTTQNNNATLENDLLLTSNSGNNIADKNTGGNTMVETGDANTEANVLNFLNNNVAGQVIFGIVNIFGDLIGDIILPETTPTSGIVANTGNGTGSTNIATLDQAFTNDTFQTNNAEIINNLNLEAQTGDNQAGKNTGGNTTIETGDANIETQVLNIVNSNISLGNWWLVLVNEAGEWIGRLVGSPEDSNFAGSEGTQFSVDANGDVTAQNIGNGSDSQNTISTTQSANNNTIQNNIAKILNNINLISNTGGNSTSSNTGGNTAVKTGDANVIANLVNFVNNNIVGSGKLTVVTINVFGKWVGNFLSPGAHKNSLQTETVTEQENTTTEALTSQPTIQTNNSSSNNPGNNNNSSNNSVPQNNNPAPLTTTVNTQNTSAYLNNNPVDTQVEVAGVKIPADESPSNLPQNLSKKITINLAWVLLLLPFGVLFAFKKRAFTIKQLLKNK